MNEREPHTHKHPALFCQVVERAPNSVSVLLWKLLPSAENDSCLSQESEIRLKYAFDILLLTLLMKAKLKTDADLLQSFLKQQESEENPFVDTKSTEQTSWLVTDKHIPSQVFLSVCTSRPPGSLNCFQGHLKKL